LSAQERREVIERAAADVFAQRGYHGTTMAQIARASGVTVPVIYDHFPSKVALHRQIQEQGLHALGAILAGDPDAARVAAGQDPLAFEMAAEVMRAGLTGLAVWWAEHPEVPKERIVETAINVLWTGIERLRPGPSR
jgi:AcrR family transcriptional regulator